jgi:hypothetical protein
MNISDNELLLRTGGSVAVILNHKLAVGVVGSTFAGSQNIQFEGSDYSMYGGFGGLLIEPIIQPHSAIHVSFPISIGGGEAAYFKDSLGYRNWDFDYRSHFYNDFVYIEPGINVEVNLTKFMRFGVTGSYMISNTLNTSTLSTTQLDGLSLSANLKLGWFK